MNYNQWTVKRLLNYGVRNDSEWKYEVPFTFNIIVNEVKYV